MEKKQITLRLSEDLVEALDSIGEITGFSITTLVCLSVWNSMLKLF